MNTPSKTLLLSSAVLLSLGTVTPVLARDGHYRHGGYRHGRVVIVRPARTYAFRPYYHRRHIVVGPEAVYAYRPYRYYRHHPNVIIRRHHRW